MKICSKCGHRDDPHWRGSRFDFNADYMRFAEGFKIQEYQEICAKLKSRKNFDPIFTKYYAFYRRGTGGIYLYRVPKEDFKVSRERKKHGKAEK